jgi:hypothetical protein
LVPALGQSHAELVTADDLKAALYDVLSHNDLFDAVNLSDRLSIGLHISRAAAPDRNTTRYEGTATANPPALYGSINYEADVDVARQMSSVRLSFDRGVARRCGYGVPNGMSRPATAWRLTAGRRTNRSCGPRATVSA